MRRLFADAWFQMLAALCALCALIMLYDRVSPRPEFSPAAGLASEPAPASAPAAAPVPAPVPVPAPATALPTATALASGSSRADAEARRSPEEMIRTPIEAAVAPASPVGVAPDAGVPTVATPRAANFARPAMPAARAALPAAPRDAAPAPAIESPSAAAAPPSSFPIFRIVPKTPGRWIVSTEQGPDVDSPSIERVIYSASNGDVVLIRPGIYAEPLAVKDKTLAFRGLGRRPEEVLVTSPDPTAVLRVDHGTVRLENLRIEPEKGFSATAAAVYALSGNVTLRKAIVRSRGAALQAAEGAGSETVVDAASSRFDGAYADILIRGQARVTLTDDDFANPRQPLVVWRDTSVTLDSCRFAGGDAARMYAYEQSSVDAARSPLAPAVSARREETDADADKARFAAVARATPHLRSRLRNIFQTGR